MGGQKVEGRTQNKWEPQKGGRPMCRSPKGGRPMCGALKGGQAQYFALCFLLLP